MLFDCFTKDVFKGGHVLLLTPAQINRLDKAQVEGRRAQIHMSAIQVAKNVSYIGGFIGMLASHADGALPSGLLSGGISKAISADGFIRHKHGKCC